MHCRPCGLGSADLATIRLRQFDAAVALRSAARHSVTIQPIPGSNCTVCSAGPLKGEDLYHPDHGRYVLMASPGVGDMEFLGFEKVYYDKKDHTMRGRDSTRKV